MKKSTIDQLRPYQNLPVSLFCEKMTALCIQEYNHPDAFFELSKKAFLINQDNYTDTEQNKAIMNIFRDCYRAYNSQERRKLGDRFLDFVRDLDLNDTVSYHVYEAFFLLIRKRPEGEDFLVHSLHEEKFQEIINRDFAQEYSDYDNDLYRSVFVKRSEEIADCLFDSTYLSIAKTMSDRYTMYDYVIQSLLKREKTEIVKTFVDNTNFLCSKSCLNDIIAYAKAKGESELLLAAYHLFLMKNSVTFADFYSYYMMLSPEQKEEDEYFLERTVRNNHFDKAYQIMSGIDADSLLLKGLNLEEFTLLSQVIKERYSKTYLAFLRQAIEKKTSLPSVSYDDLFACLNAYSEDLPQLLACPGVKEASLSSDSARYQYLKLLKDHSLLEQAGIISYQD